MELASLDNNDARAREVFLQQEAIMRQVQQDRLKQQQGASPQRQPEGLPPAYVSNNDVPGYVLNNYFPGNDQNININYNHGQNSFVDNNGVVPMGLNPQPAAGGAVGGGLISPDLANLVLGLSQPSIAASGAQHYNNPAPAQAYATSQQQQLQQPVPIALQPQQPQSQQQLQQPIQDNSIPMGLNPQPAAPSVIPQAAHPLVMGVNVQDAKQDFLPCDVPPEYRFQKGVGCAHACSKNQHFRAICLSLILFYLLISFLSCGLNPPEYCGEGSPPGYCGRAVYCRVLPIELVEIFVQH